MLTKRASARDVTNHREDGFPSKQLVRHLSCQVPFDERPWPASLTPQDVKPY